MARAYVGTADCNGLKLFFLEDKTLLAQLATSAESAYSRAQVAFWATVSEELASAVRLHLCRGERKEALFCLEAQAIEIAPLVPSFELLPASVAGGIQRD